MSEINTILTRVGVAANSGARMLIRSAISISAGLGVAIAVIPDIVLNAIPGQPATRDNTVVESVNWFIAQYTSWNQILPVSESFASFLAYIAVRNFCFVWRIIRTSIETADQINPLG